MEYRARVNSDWIESVLFVDKTISSENARCIRKLTNSVHEILKVMPFLAGLAIASTQFYNITSKNQIFGCFIHVIV